MAGILSVGITMFNWLRAAGAVAALVIATFNSGAWAQHAPPDAWAAPILISPPQSNATMDDDDADAAHAVRPGRSMYAPPPRPLFFPPPPPLPPPFFAAPHERASVSANEPAFGSRSYEPDAPPRPPSFIGTQRPDQDYRPNPSSAPTNLASLPPEDQAEQGTKELPPQFKRQLVSYATPEPAGTIVIDTANTYLYLVLGNGKALRYGIGVGREGFTWAGAERVSRMAEWPDWHPPAEMIERQPYLPRFMAGGPGNPLGARALYLGKTLYRIHGTNQPSTIGTFVSSGCIRLVNSDIEDLYSRVQVGARVVVLQSKKPPATAAN
jgi:lipoprotein-anchoring transpeptidase ErfK/SrfK